MEFARAERFSLDMQNYEHARLLGILAAAEKRWKLKHLRRRFFTWRRGVRLAHKAEHEVHLRGVRNQRNVVWRAPSLRALVLGLLSAWALHLA